MNEFFQFEVCHSFIHEFVKSVKDNNFIEKQLKEKITGNFIKK